VLPTDAFALIAAYLNICRGMDWSLRSGSVHPAPSSEDRHHPASSKIS
jgi:hypothetical protein